MSKDALQPARKIARALRPSEDVLDTSLIKSAELLISIIEARMETGVSAEYVHDAVISAMAGITALTDARGHLVTCHKQLADARDGLGLHPVAVGCTIRKPNGDAGQAPLSLVADAA